MYKRYVTTSYCNRDVHTINYLLLLVVVVVVV